MSAARSDTVKLLLTIQASQVDGEDELKKRQLMELAIINGTYRDCNCKCAARRVTTMACVG